MEETLYCKHFLAWQDDEEDSDSDDMPEANHEEANEKESSCLGEASNNSAGAASNQISEGWRNDATV